MNQGSSENALEAEAGDCEQKAIDLFLRAKRGEQIDGRQLNKLSERAKLLRKALSVLDYSPGDVADWERT